MPTVVLLATTDPLLKEQWVKQLPLGMDTRSLSDLTENPALITSGLISLVVLDIASENELHHSLLKFPTILIGEPRSHPFEQARLSKRAYIFLSYDESKIRLGDYVPIVNELAEKQILIDMLREKGLRFHSSRTEQKIVHSEALDLWEFLEGAAENLDSRDRLIAEFRRASRQLLRASHAVFLLRDGDGFRADRGTSFLSANDPIVGYFEAHPALIDGANWDSPADPAIELAIRRRLALWGARLLVPIHESGQLLGIIALGIRDDGLPYSESCRARSIHLARLLRHLLNKSNQLERLTHLSEKAIIGAKYLPGTIVLNKDEPEPRNLPLVVRDLIGQVRRTGADCAMHPDRGQPFRASAGIIAETGGVWAAWQEASNEVQDTLARDRSGRREILRELALTLNHELGNSLVSLTSFKHAGTDRPMPGQLLETVKNDVSQLQALNNTLSFMQSFHEATATLIDVRDIAKKIAETIGVRLDITDDPLILSASAMLLDFSLRSILQTIDENRIQLGLKDVTLKLRSAGIGNELTALFSIKGEKMELEGILPEPIPDAVPNQGRLKVFLAKEIISLHNGQIHAGPGIEGTEILISVRKW